MIYTYLEGRIGNCLFEIATGASLAKSIGVPYKALICSKKLLTPPDKCILADYLKPFRKSILRKIDFSDIYPENQVDYIESQFGYSPLPLQDNIILKGFFQSEKYFDKELVRHLFEIDTETETYICEKYGHILQLNPVAINVRRGDYLKLEFKHPVCRMPFFNKAMACFDAGTYFLVISDDIAWCKKHFKGDRYFFVDDEPPLIDLYLQAMCQHNIISNSTFSWWGAWLNPNPNKKVIYPEPWFGIMAEEKSQTKDLCPESWIPISVGRVSYLLRGTLSYLKWKSNILRFYGSLLVRKLK